MLAFLARRKETPMTATVTKNTSQTNDDVLMRFLTQGGATVRLYRHTWNETYYCGSQAGQTAQKHGLEWSCTGCDTTGAEKNLRLSSHGYDEHEPRDSRRDANDHASKCRAMPKPTA